MGKCLSSVLVNGLFFIRDIPYERVLVMWRCYVSTTVNAYKMVLKRLLLYEGTAYAFRMYTDQDDTNYDGEVMLIIGVILIIEQNPNWRQLDICEVCSCCH